MLPTGCTAQIAHLRLQSGFHQVCKVLIQTSEGGRWKVSRGGKGERNHGCVCVYERERGDAVITDFGSQRGFPVAIGRD